MVLFQRFHCKSDFLLCFSFQTQTRQGVTLQMLAGLVIIGSDEDDHGRSGSGSGTDTGSESTDTGD